MHSPDLFRETDRFIVNAAQVFYDEIINDSIPIRDMTLVLQTAIFESQYEALVILWSNVKHSLITSGMAELYHAIIPCNIRTKDELVATSIDNPSQWNAVL